MPEISHVAKASKVWKLVLTVVGLCFWTTSFVLWYHYALTRPSVRRSREGRTYALNTHGTVVYLTPHEHMLLYSLIAAGVVCFLLTAGFYYFESRKMSN